MLRSLALQQNMRPWGNGRGYGIYCGSDTVGATRCRGWAEEPSLTLRNVNSLCFLVVNTHPCMHTVIQEVKVLLLRAKTHLH